ncbi:rhomboid family intramembrane serine protease [Roseovarius aestuariivivens]|uniref:rhomboid family intramembrane serine protease n=1 Tax=Roseovarius aestuariivivens TaxID=1888910 RepID=UPI0010810065|nr:rhomboid family intramembrane serine protease [Roseovarius aestuariivivens]
MSDDQDYIREPSPFNAVPPLVVVVALAIFVIECLFALGARGMVGGPQAVGWRLEAIQDFAFSNRAQAWMIENGVLRVDFLWRYLTYPFVHGSFLHAGFAAAMVLALGKFVGERMAGWAVMAVFFGASMLGVAIYGLLFPDGPGYYGAYPGVYGLIGGFTYLVWLRLGQMGENQIRAFTMIGFLLAIQLVFGLMYGGGSGWVADVAGFAAGFGLSFVLAPGGWAKIRDRLRQR